MSEQETLAALLNFVENRDWAQFHTKDNLAKSISIEAGELLESFQWGQAVDDDEVTEELADVLTYCFLLALKIGVSPNEIILKKLRKTEEKYPVTKSKGKSTKYDRL
jgi:NTP pyrophosphatase (non-canonical NTP hydrolase)